MSRHIPKSIREVWESFEHLLRDDLRRMDHRARCMYTEMALTREAKSDDILAFMQHEFAKLWREVADEQKKKGASA